MSATLKFGTDGNWATKKGSTLAYNDTNGNFKPLPFTFDRSTSATRVNKEGLIEVVSNNEPRIDFLNDSKGALLLEPSRSNLITYSEDFSNAYYNTGSTIVSSNAIASPEGVLNADKITEDASNGYHYKRRLFSVSGEFTMSIFVKKEERDKIWLGNVSTVQYSIFDLTNESSTNAGTTSSKIENYGNGWYRCTVVDTLNQSAFLSFGLVDDNNNINYQGDGTSGLYAWGFQYEANTSYATSYIPTQGSIGTRVADVNQNQVVPNGIIGQTEGTIYIETDAILSGTTNGYRKGYVHLNNGSYSNRIEITKEGGSNINNANDLRIRISVGGVNQFDENIKTDAQGHLKIAFAYKNGDVAAYINGISVFTKITPTLIPATNNIYIGNAYSNEPISEPILDARLYNTRLTNAELQALTKI